MKDCSPWNRPRQEQEKSVKRKEQQRHSCPVPLNFSVVRMWSQEQKSEAWEEQAGRGGVFNFVFVSHYPTLIFFQLAINEFNFPQVKSGLPMTVIGKSSLCAHLDLQAFPFYFLPILLRKGRERSLAGTRQPAKVNPSHLFCRQE